MGLHPHALGPIPITEPFPRASRCEWVRAPHNSCQALLVSLFHSCTFLLSRSGTAVTQLPHSTCADGWHPRVPLSPPRPMSLRDPDIPGLCPQPGARFPAPRRALTQPRGARGGSTGTGWAPGTSLWEAQTHRERSVPIQLRSRQLPATFSLRWAF